MVRSGDIIGIFDMDNTTISKWTRRFLNKAEKQGQVICVTTDLPKTFVLVCPEQQQKRGATASQPKQKVYLSQISSATLRKRTGYHYTSKQY